MKKVALSLLAFGLIGAGAFAQAAAPTVTIGEWGRQIIAFGSGDSNTWVGTGASWGSNPRIVGLNIQAKTDTVGFSITPSADNGVFGLTDQNKAWINPIPGLTVESGISLETDTWRGVRDFNSYNWLRSNGEHGDSITFGRLGNGGQAASDINYNKDGIGAWVLVAYPGNAGTQLYDSTGNKVYTDASQNNAYSVANPGPTTFNTNGIGSYTQAGVAYTIPSLGQIKAQYIGFKVNAESGPATLFGTAGSGKPFGAYQVAFNLSAVKDLYEEVGVMLPSNASDAGYDFQVTDLVGYTMDKLTLNGQLIYVSYNNKNKVVVAGNTFAPGGAGLAGGVGFDYDLGDSVGLGADYRYENQLAMNSGAIDKGYDATLSTHSALSAFTVGVTKGFSNGLIGAAFEYSTTGFAWGQGDDGKGHWAVPVRLEYWF